VQVSVRKTLPQDLPHFYDICLRTGDNGKDASAFFYDPWLLGQYYAAPYVFFPGALCFTAEDGGIPRGYIVSVPCTPAFDEWMENVWLPPLRLRYPSPFPEDRARSPYEARIASLLHLPHPSRPEPPWRAGYPAHLHIDLLPEIQGKGCGRRLMEGLCGALREASVPGVHLGVSRLNTGAVAFYGRMGFSRIEEDEGGYTMVLKLQGPRP
jgi:GNAT superfamily N-acetyltransferase